MAERTSTITIEDSGLLKLAKGLSHDGSKITELYYDINEVSYSLYNQAEAMATKALMDQNAMKLTVSNFSEIAKLHYGWACILAAEKNKDLGLDFDDLVLLKGPDLKRVGNLGSVFLADLGEDLQPESYELQ